MQIHKTHTRGPMEWIVLLRIAKVNSTSFSPMAGRTIAIGVEYIFLSLEGHWDLAIDRAKVLLSRAQTSWPSGVLIGPAARCRWSTPIRVLCDHELNALPPNLTRQKQRTDTAPGRRNAQNLPEPPLRAESANVRRIGEQVSAYERQRGSSKGRPNTVQRSNMRSGRRTSRTCLHIRLSWYGE